MTSASAAPLLRAAGGHSILIRVMTCGHPGQANKMSHEIAKIGPILTILFIMFFLAHTVYC